MNRNAKIDIVASGDIYLPTNKFKKICDTILKKKERDNIWEKFLRLKMNNIK